MLAAMPGSRFAFLASIVFMRFEEPLDRFSDTSACEAHT